MKYIKKFRILLVDDNEYFLKAMEFRLHEFLDGNFEYMHTAHNGCEAIEKARNQTYDIIFMDIDMPVLNGIKATRYLNTHYSYLRIIALSLYKDFPYLEEMIYAGACTYIIKSDLDNHVLKKAFQLT